MTVRQTCLHAPHLPQPRRAWGLAASSWSRGAGITVLTQHLISVGGWISSRVLVNHSGGNGTESSCLLQDREHLNDCRPWGRVSPGDLLDDVQGFRLCWPVCRGTLPSSHASSSLSPHVRGQGPHPSGPVAPAMGS